MEAVQREFRLGGGQVTGGGVGAAVADVQLGADGEDVGDRDRRALPVGLVEQGTEVVLRLVAVVGEQEGAAAEQPGYDEERAAGGGGDEGGAGESAYFLAVDAGHAVFPGPDPRDGRVVHRVGQGGDGEDVEVGVVVAEEGGDAAQDGQFVPFGDGRVLVRPGGVRPSCGLGAGRAGGVVGAGVPGRSGAADLLPPGPVAPGGVPA